ncbi:MAG: hypothetical protein QXD77_00885 [Candidatus Aenigmatarchaeota archaeon]
MVTRESVHNEVLRRYQRALERLRPMTEEDDYKEKAYAQIEKITKAWGFEEDAKKKIDNRIWRLLDEEAQIPAFDGDAQIEHLLEPIYAALRAHGGMYDFEIAHAIRKPVFIVKHGLAVLARESGGCPLKALGSKCVALDATYVGARSATDDFGGCSEPIMRYANTKSRGTGVIFAPRKVDDTTEAVFLLADESEAIWDSEKKKFSYNGKTIEPPELNDLFRKSWYEWRAKHR